MIAGIVKLRTGLLILVLAGAGGCGLTTIATAEAPDPEAIPSGPPSPAGDEATGPVVEVGSGRVSGIGWRYVVYESAGGVCTQFETIELTSTGCGSLLPEEGRAFGAVGSLESQPGGIRPIEGIVTSEIFTVWLVDESSTGRVPAILMPLEPAGLDAQAFVGFAPEGMTVTHLLALRMNGEILETYELP